MQSVLLMGHDPDETFGVAPSTLDAAGLPWTVHQPDEPLPRPAEVSGIVLFGGAMNVDQTDRYPFLAEEIGFVRSAVAAGTPFLGICLGAQMLARALDHPVYPAGIREFGFEQLHPTAAAAHDRLLSAFEVGARVFHWHEDTFDLPDGATLLATGDHVETQAFRYGETSWGLQFHFEVDRAEVELWLEAAGEDVVRSWGKTSRQILEEADRHLEAHEARARAVFGRFWDLVRTRSEDPATLG
jgi:GMP synthase (glutamine-hydrolysing)